MCPPERCRGMGAIARNTSAARPRCLERTRRRRMRVLCSTAGWPCSADGGPLKSNRTRACNDPPRRSPSGYAQNTISCQPRLGGYQTLSPAVRGHAHMWSAVRTRPTSARYPPLIAGIDVFVRCHLTSIRARNAELGQAATRLGALRTGQAMLAPYPGVRRPGAAAMFSGRGLTGQRLPRPRPLGAESLCSFASGSAPRFHL